MRKILALALASFLLLGLLTGCDEEEPAPTTLPAATEVAPDKATEATEAATEVSPDDSPLNTAALRTGDPELKARYILLALNAEGPFLSEKTFNETGADALIRWLHTETAQTVLKNFGMEELGEAIYTLPETEFLDPEKIAPAGEDATIHLSVADGIDDSGVLDLLIPVFEETYGYTVEIQSASATGAIATAKLGLFDLVLTEATAASEAFVAEGYARVVEDFEAEAVELCTGEYLLCGPEKDPAGVASCDSLEAAFQAISAGEYLFLSRGDDSSNHKLEQSLWPEEQTFGSWYLSVETDMGPLLVMNEFEGGYVLADKLTWLRFCLAQGVI